MLRKHFHLLLLGGLAFAACDTPTTAETSKAQTEAEAPEATMTETPVVEGELADYTDGLQIGETAPDFSLKNVDGKLYSLADIKDANGEAPKGYIVTFTCNTCPYAQAYEDRLIELHNKMAANGYPLVAIQPNDPGMSSGDSFTAMQQRAKQKNFPFVYLMDDKQEIFPQYGATKTPEIYLLDADRVLRYTGAVDDSAQEPEAVTVNYVESAIAAIEEGRSPEPAQVRAIGCSIKKKRT